MISSTQLVDTGWLVEHLTDREVLVCDCRFAGTKEASETVYDAGHVPGAIHVYWLEALCTADTTVTTFLPTAAEAQRSLGALGIAEGTFVVGYAEAASPYAARLWHVLTHYGHERVALLDGGVDKWLAEGRPLQRERVFPKRSAFKAEASNGTIATAQEIRARLDDPTLRLIDVRNGAEYAGGERRAKRGGHIPGAVLLPWEGNLREDGTLRSPVEIRERAESAGIDPEDEAVSYCQGGVRAAHTALALKLAGYPNVRVYDGSWAEWGNDPSLPVDTDTETALAAV